MEWISVSTAQCVLLINLDERAVRVVEEEREEYYGVSWFPRSDELVLSHSDINNDDLVDLTGYLKADVGYVSHGISRSAGFLSQPHQILCLPDGRVLCTDTGRNALAVVDLASSSVQEVWLGPGRWDRFDPSGEPGRHLNSLWLEGDVLHVVAHGHEHGSSVLRLSYPGLEVIDEVRVPHATGLHNIVVLPNGRRVACHSFASGLIDVDSGETIWRVPVAHGAWYTRGLAVTQDSILVGGSRQAARALRRSSPSMVWVIEQDSLQTVAAYDLGPFGAVHEVRVLDEPDIAHHGEPFAGLASLNDRSVLVGQVESVPIPTDERGWQDSAGTLLFGNPAVIGSWVCSPEDSLTLVLGDVASRQGSSWSFSYRLPDSPTEAHASIVRYSGFGGDSHMDALLVKQVGQRATLTHWVHDGQGWEPGRTLLTGLSLSGKLKIRDVVARRGEALLAVRAGWRRSATLTRHELVSPDGRIGMRLFNAQGRLEGRS